jgi:hypothetical protein
MANGEWRERRGTRPEGGGLGRTGQESDVRSPAPCKDASIIKEPSIVRIIEEHHQHHHSHSLGTRGKRGEPPEEEEEKNYHS